MAIKSYPGRTWTVAQLADDLEWSEKTIRTHLSNQYLKGSFQYGMWLVNEDDNTEEFAERRAFLAARAATEGKR